MKIEQYITMYAKTHILIPRYFAKSYRTHFNVISFHLDYDLMLNLAVMGGTVKKVAVSSIIFAIIYAPTSLA